MRLNDLPEVMSTAEDLIRLRLLREDLERFDCEFAYGRDFSKLFDALQSRLTVGEKKDVMGILKRTVARDIAEREDFLVKAGIDPRKE